MALINARAGARHTGLIEHYFSTPDIPGSPAIRVGHSERDEKRERKDKGVGEIGERVERQSM